MASKRPDLRRAFTDTESGAFVSDASAEVMDAAFTRGNAMTTGNLNVLSWEGDGQQRRFVIDGRAPASIDTVLENVERWPVGRFGLDTGFRWSYDGSALIVADDQLPPAEGVIVICTYEPEPYEGEGEWTDFVVKPLDPSDTERQLLAARAEAAFGLRAKP